MKMKLKLFFEWGIQFEEEPCVVAIKDHSTIKYANKDILISAIRRKYPLTEENKMYERSVVTADDECDARNIDGSSELTENSIFLGQQPRKVMENASHPNKIEA